MQRHRVFSSLYTHNNLPALHIPRLPAGSPKRKSILPDSPQTKSAAIATDAAPASSNFKRGPTQRQSSLPSQTLENSKSHSRLPKCSPRKESSSGKQSATRRATKLPAVGRSPKQRRRSKAELTKAEELVARQSAEETQQWVCKMMQRKWLSSDDTDQVQGATGLLRSGKRTLSLSHGVSEATVPPWRKSAPYLRADFLTAEERESYAQKVGSLGREEGAAAKEEAQAEAEPANTFVWDWENGRVGKDGNSFTPPTERDSTAVGKTAGSVCRAFSSCFSLPLCTFCCLRPVLCT